MPTTISPEVAAAQQRQAAAAAAYLRDHATCQDWRGCRRSARHAWDIGGVTGKYFLALCPEHWLEQAPVMFKRAAAG
jgi:hypothetical protein